MAHTIYRPTASPPFWDAPSTITPPQTQKAEEECNTLSNGYTENQYAHNSNNHNHHIHNEQMYCSKMQPLLTFPLPDTQNANGNANGNGRMKYMENIQPETLYIQQQQIPHLANYRQHHQQHQHQQQQQQQQQQQMIHTNEHEETWEFPTRIIQGSNEYPETVYDERETSYSPNQLLPPLPYYGNMTHTHTKLSTNVQDLCTTNMPVKGRVLRTKRLDNLNIVNPFKSRIYGPTLSNGRVVLNDPPLDFDTNIMNRPANATQGWQPTPRNYSESDNVRDELQNQVNADTTKPKGKRKATAVQHIFRSGVKWYPCTFCSKLFKRAEHHRRHTLSHTGERPYQCTCCDRNFSRMDNLATHIKLHEKNRIAQRKTTPNTPELPITPPVSAGCSILGGIERSNTIAFMQS